jgi:hypothetical protein
VKEADWLIFVGGGMKAENIHTGGGWEKWTTGLKKCLGVMGNLPYTEIVSAPN